MDRGRNERALADLRVLDLTDEKGVYCAKLLADLGADVVRVEDPRGDRVRQHPPFFHDRVDADLSLFHFHFNTNKRSITLDLASADGRDLFKKMVQTRDVIVESFPAGYLADLGLDYDTLRNINPRLIMASITGFGHEGPYSRFKAPDIVGVAMGGLMFLGGFPGETPFYPGAYQAYHLAATDAAIGILVALSHRDASGCGQHVDISMETSVSEAIEYGMVLWDLRKMVRGRTGRAVFRDWNEVFPCKDGYIMCSPLGGAGWEKMLAWMDSEGAAGDLSEPINQAALKVMAWGQMDAASLPPDVDRDLLQKNPQLVPHVEDVWQAFLKKHSRVELYEKCQELGVRLMPIHDIKDVIEDPQLRSRDFFASVFHPELDAVLQYPGAPYRLSLTPWRIERRAPSVGEHNAEVFEQELGLSKRELSILKASGTI